MKVYFLINFHFFYQIYQIYQINAMRWDSLSRERDGRKDRIKDTFRHAEIN